MTYPTLNTSVGRVVEACPGSADFLMQLGIDCGRHCGESFAAVVADAGLPPSDVLRLICESCESLPAEEVRDWPEVPLPEMIDYIIATHHAFARRQLPRLQLLLEKASKDDGTRCPELTQIREVFSEFRASLEAHLRTEEEVLFPMMRTLVVGRGRTGVFAGPSEPCVQEIHHDEAAVQEDLRGLRSLTQNFRGRPDASPAYQAFLQGMSDLEANLERHAYLEDGFLFPRAQKLERELCGRSA